MDFDEVNPEDPSPPKEDQTKVESRVGYIAELMSKGEWRSSLQEYKKLGLAWGVDPSTVRRYAAEAHRLIAWDMDERQGLRRSLAATMHGIYEDAMTRYNLKTGLPDYQSAIKATEDFARFAGIQFDQQEPPDNVVMLSAAEIEKRVRALLAAKDVGRVLSDEEAKSK